MENKSTGDLGQELMNQPNLDAYIRDNQAQFSDCSVIDLLLQLFDRKSFQGGTGPARGHQRGIPPSGIFRTAQALP